MDLSIDFECPECKKIQSQKLMDIAPGRRQTCLACGTPTELTESGLADLLLRIQESYGAKHQLPARDV